MYKVTINTRSGENNLILNAGDKFQVGRGRGWRK